MQSLSLAGVSLSDRRMAFRSMHSSVSQARWGNVHSYNFSTARTVGVKIAMGGPVVTDSLKYPADKAGSKLMNVPELRR